MSCLPIFWSQANDCLWRRSNGFHNAKILVDIADGALWRLRFEVAPRDRLSKLRLLERFIFSWCRPLKLTIECTRESAYLSNTPNTLENPFAAEQKKQSNFDMTLNPFPESVPQSPTSSSSGTAIAPAASTPSQSPQNGFTRTVYDGMLDIEEDLSKPVPAGYPALVKLIVKYPEFEAFQSFKDLNIKSLLYYQAELDELRRDLHRLEWRDYRGEPFHGAEECCLTVDRLLWGRDSGDKNAGRQYKKMEKIREVLKEYSAFNSDASVRFSTHTLTCHRCCLASVFKDLRPAKSRQFQR